MHHPIHWANTVTYDELFALLSNALDQPLQESTNASTSLNWVDQPHWRKLACRLWIDYRNMGLNNPCLGRSWWCIARWNMVRYTHWRECTDDTRVHVLQLEKELQRVSGLMHVDRVYESIMSRYCSDAFCMAWDYMMQDHETPSVQSLRQWSAYTMRRSILDPKDSF